MGEHWNPCQGLSGAYHTDTCYFASVFVHRYRDKDPAIRADCLRMLGKYMKAYPEKYVVTTYLQYVDWALTDQVSLSWDG